MEAQTTTVTSTGIWCMDSTPNMVHLLARSGFDWVCLDAQHGTFGRAEITAAARGYPNSNAAGFFVRVPSVDVTWIGFALDSGASGVIVPQIESQADAKAAVSGAFYPPMGNRSWGPVAALSGQPIPTAAAANSTTRCILMIESALALKNVADIAAVPGVSMLFVGPYDLALSLGTTVSELLDDKSDSSPFRIIIAAAAAAHLDVGVYAGTPELGKRFRDLGFDCIVPASDTSLLQAGIQSVLGDPLPSQPPTY